MEKNYKVTSFEELYKPRLVDAETIKCDLTICEDNLWDPSNKGFEKSRKDVDLFYVGGSIRYN